MTVQEYTSISAMGAARGLAAQSLTYPLEVVRNLQHLNQGSSWINASQLIKEKGVGSLYTGFRYKAATTCLKQIWTWPLMDKIPKELTAMNVPPLGSQAITGVTIATLDTVLTGFEKMRISSFAKESTGALKGKDYLANWSSLSVSWSTFLVGQKFFRDQLRVEDKKLSHQDLVIAGILTTTAVAIVGNYPEVIKTVRMAGIDTKIHISHVFRGFPLRLASLTIQNLFSIYLLEHLGT